jgi:hypothetical protein
VIATLVPRGRLPVIGPTEAAREGHRSAPSARAEAAGTARPVIHGQPVPAMVVLGVRIRPVTDEMNGLVPHLNGRDRALLGARAVPVVQMWGVRSSPMPVA